ncbi:MAG: formylglycine-generating enzyme family protein [Gammaproteobacteria bacterium]|nr:formylglycine-generating enzyme family protein [Gammaproteobacteria bacterium]
MNRKFLAAIFVGAVAVAGWWLGRGLSSSSQDEANAMQGQQCLVPEAVQRGTTAGMVFVPGGRFVVGESPYYTEEGPPREVTLAGFWIDRNEITNDQFAAFVADTGYVTLAERVPDAKKYPWVPAEMRVPGGVVFTEPESITSLANPAQWWQWVPGANWRHPFGPDSAIDGRGAYPVVQIAYEDAEAYAAWAGHELPTEAQFEFAARGGLDLTEPPLVVNGQYQANYWQGVFPVDNSAGDGYRGMAPVGCFPANGYGVFDLLGNVWEWVADWYAPSHIDITAENPQGPSLEQSGDPNQPEAQVRTIKGGSYLCAANYCVRYRPAARQPQDVGLGTAHIGFRTVINRGPEGSQSD